MNYIEPQFSGAFFVRCVHIVGTGVVKVSLFVGKMILFVDWEHIIYIFARILQKILFSQIETSSVNKRSPRQMKVL